MSSRRKHVTQDALTSQELPAEHERILCVVSLRGSNIVEVRARGGVVPHMTTVPLVWPQRARDGGVWRRPIVVWMPQRGGAGRAA